MITSPSALDDPTVHKVQPDDLWVPLYRTAYEAVVRRVARGHSIDKVTIIDDLRHANIVGGIAPIVDFLNEPAPSGDVTAYAEIVLRDAAARRVARSHKQIRRAIDKRLAESELTGVELALEIEKLASDLATEHANDTALRTALIAADWQDNARRLIARSDGSEKPVPSPWPAMNRALAGGWWPGLYILVGGTGAHKTTFAIQAALHAAQAGTPVLYVSLEMDALDLQARFLGLLSGEHWSALQTGRLPVPRLRSITKEFGPVLSELPLRATYISPRSPDAADELREAIREMRRVYPQKRRGERPFLVVFDFLQLVGGDAREDLRTRIGNAAYTAQELARKLDAAVLLLSSTSRENYKLVSEAVPAKKPPSMLVGTGKESGELEYSADAVLVLRPEPWKGNVPPKGPKRIDVALAKVRFGIPTWIRMTYVNGRLEEEQTEMPPADVGNKHDGGGRGTEELV